MIGRREFITLLGGVALARSSPSAARTSTRIARFSAGASDVSSTKRRPPDLRSLQRVDASFGDVAVLNRGRAGDPDGTDDLAILHEGNAALERGGAAQREQTHVHAALRHQILEHLARPPEIKRAACF